MRKLGILLFAIFAALMTSCIGPYKKEMSVEIAPNETAFVIPLEQGNENQGKFGSEKYLSEKKVAAKRIILPQRKRSTGRMWWSYEYIPTVRVIRVDRSPVTREWTDASNTGTNSKKQDVEVESSESIGFGIGVTVTASIPEEWAAKFLYNYNGRSLSEVIDYNVRSYVQDLLTGEFGSRDLSKCQKERAAIFAIMKKETADFFASRGIRIDNIGAAGEFAYKDQAIQDAINAKFTAKMKVEAAQNEVEAANKFMTARKSIEAQKLLDAKINLMNSQADLNRGIAKGKVKMPTYYAPGANQPPVPYMNIKK